MRILHFSDPHIPTPLHRIPLMRWLSKRAIGATNLFLGRSRLFTDAAEKLGKLARFAKDHKTDLVICTGDYTALGLAHEYQEAVRTVRPLMDAPRGYINVPGNHDYYLADTLHDNRFATYFGDTLISDMPQYQVDEPWPLVKFVGDKVAVIAVNSSRPNPQPWRSSGKIPPKQLEVLEQLASDVNINRRFVFIITHYAPLLADGSPDSRLHGLTNAEDFLDSCALFSEAAILCGHVHRCYHVRVPKTGQSIFCAGSATIHNHEGFWLFEVDHEGMRATKGGWQNGRYHLLEKSEDDNGSDNKGSSV